VFLLPFFFEAVFPSTQGKAERHYGSWGGDGHRTPDCRLQTAMRCTLVPCSPVSLIDHRCNRSDHCGQIFETWLIRFGCKTCTNAREKISENCVADDEGMGFPPFWEWYLVCTVGILLAGGWLFVLLRQNILPELHTVLSKVASLTLACLLTSSLSVVLTRRTLVSILSKSCKRTSTKEIKPHWT
jgi:hypothetical protein